MMDGVSSEAHVPLHEVAAERSIGSCCQQKKLQSTFCLKSA
jgi:hypothetical protein